MIAMRSLQIIKWVGLFVLLAVLLAAGMLWWQASRAPAGYRPADLTVQQRQESATSFVNRQVLSFVNQASEGRPYELHATEQEINHYLASMDEIAANMPGGRTGQVSEALARARLSGPAIELGGGRARLMLQSLDIDKILSVDLKPTFTPEGRLRIEIQQAMIGRVAVPLNEVRRQIVSLQRQLAHAVEQKSGGDAVTKDELGRMLAAVLLAVDGQPVELVWKNRVRVNDIRINAQGITVQIVPIGGSR